MAFEFFDPGPLIDGDLELIVPEEKWIDEILRRPAHPVGRLDPSANITRQQIEDYLRAAPAGRYVPGPKEVRVPAISILDAAARRVQTAGRDRRRHRPAHRRQRRPAHAPGPRRLQRLPRRPGPSLRRPRPASCFSRSRQHGLREIWITCNPENIASRRTCQFLGATFVGTVPLPKNHILYRAASGQMPISPRPQRTGLPLVVLQEEKTPRWPIEA